MPTSPVPARRTAAITALLLGSLAPAGLASGIQYNVTNLGIREPIALNDAGQVALNQATSFGYADPLYSSGYPDAGSLRHTGQSTYTHALLYNSYGPGAGGMTFVGQNLPAATSDPNGLDSVTTNAGKVIAKPETSDIATGLTASGQVAVTSAAGSFLTDGKTYQAAPAPAKLPDPGALGSIGGNDATVHAMNAAGQVVGSATTAVLGPENHYGAPSHAFVSIGGAMKDLGVLGGTESAAYGINAKGMIVGASDPQPYPTTDPRYYYPTARNYFQSQHAFLSDGTTMTDLNSAISDQLNLTLNRAVAINGAGQILAYGQAGSNGLENAYLLTPVDQPTPVDPTLAPEPSTLALLGVVAGALYIRHRRTRRPAAA